MKPKSIVLLSAGLDSTVALAKAMQETEVIYTLTFDYGQRASLRENDLADEIAEHYNLPFESVKLPWLYSITDSALVNMDKDVPELSEEEIRAGGDTMKEAAEQVWVPNRNGVFVSIAGAYAEAMEAEMVVAGFNAEEGAHFSDNSQAFIDATNKALSHSTRSQVKLHAPLAGLSKKEIVKLGHELKIPVHLVWPCYHGEEEICGRCVSCSSFYMALEATELDGWYEQEKAKHRPEELPAEQA